MSLPDRRFSIAFSSENSDQRMNVGFEDGQSMQMNFGEVTTVTSEDYDKLYHKPLINGVELSGDHTTEELGISQLPSGGSVGDIVMMGSNGVTWEAPATSAEADNTKPITSAAVYTEIGNINALLSTI